MKCPMCGETELINEARDIPHQYMGKKTIISGVKGDYCLSCGDGILDKEDFGRLNNSIIEFIKLVDGEILK